MKLGEAKQLRLFFLPELISISSGNDTAKQPTPYIPKSEF
jgi:hypothetical protein